MTPRPTNNDATVIADAAEKLTEQYADDFDIEFEDEDDYDRKSFVHMFTKILTNHQHDNAYKLAKVMDEDYGMEVDKETVDFCDDMYMQLINSTDLAVFKWIDANGIKPSFNVGDNVKIIETDKWSSNNKIERSGKIVSITRDGKYGVFIEGKHISGNDGKPKSYSMFTWEEVEKWNGICTKTNQPDLFDAAKVIVPN